MAAAAGVAGFVVARVSNLSKPKAVTTQANGYGPSNSGGTYLVTLSAVPANGGLILDTQKIVLVKDRDGSVKGFSAICTHQGCTVATVQDGVISCPCHGSEFSAVTGAVIQGPATRPLPAIGVVVRDNAVYTD
jgi:Rieske Fe-S protein